MEGKWWCLPFVYRKEYAKKLKISVMDFPECSWWKLDNRIRLLDRNMEIVKEFDLYTKTYNKQN